MFQNHNICLDGLWFIKVMAQGSVSIIKVIEEVVSLMKTNEKKTGEEFEGKILF